MLQHRPWLAVLLACSVAACQVPGAARSAKGKVTTASTKKGAPSRQALESQLRKLLDFRFASNRAAIVSNNGSGVISNNGGNIVSNNGGGVISNNGGNVISNNGGSLGGKAYHVAATQVTIALQPLPGEKVYTEQHYLNGSAFLQFLSADQLQSRRVLVGADGVAYREEAVSILERWPSGVTRTGDILITLSDARHRRLIYAPTHVEQDEHGRMLKRTLKAPVELEDEDAGVRATAEKLDVDVTAGKGEFDVRYTSAGLRLKGHVTAFAPGVADAGADLAYFDPLGMNQGVSDLLNDAGDLVCRVENTLNGRLVTQRVTYPSGLALELVNTAEGDPTAKLFQNDALIGDVKVKTGADGTVTFTVTLLDDPKHPFDLAVTGRTTGGEATPEPLLGSTAPAGIERWLVHTLTATTTRGFADGPLEKAVLAAPTGVAYGETFTAFTDSRNHRIRAVGFDGQNVWTLAGTGTGGRQDGPPSQATFQNPTGLVFGPDGSAYVADTGNHLIRVVAASGVVSTLAGGAAAGFTDGKGTAAAFHHPAAIARSGDVLYVADFSNNAVRKVTLDGTVTTLAGGGAPGFADGKGAAAKFNGPQALAVDSHGDLFVSDVGNARIRRIDPQGNVTTVAGGAEATLIDGDRAKARLFAPAGLAFDFQGNLYFNDACAVRRMSPDGHIQSVAGSITAGVFSDGEAQAATFLLPIGLAVNLAGDQLVVTDSDANAIRLINRADATP